MWQVMRVWDGMKNEVSAEQLDFSVEDLDHGPDASNETDLGPLTGITGGVSGIDQEDIEEVDLDEVCSCVHLQLCRHTL